MGKLYLLSLISAWVCLTYAQKMGPFKVLIKKLDACGSSDGKAWIFEPKLKKFNRTVFTADGRIIMNSDFDDSMLIKVEMAQFTNNGWKENYFQQIWSKGCSTVKSYAPELFNSVTVGVIGQKPKCPMKEGNYSFHDFPLVVNLNNVPAFFYNRYRFIFHILSKGSSLFCFVTEVDVVPKNKKR